MDPVLMRHPVVQKDGLMTREWLRFQNQLQMNAAQVGGITQNITNIQTGSSFDDTCVRDFQPAIWEAFLQDQESTRPVYDDTELRNALAGSDTAHVYDDTELRNAAAGLDVPNTLGLQQQIDELRALAAAADPPLPLANGATGTITIPKISTTTGSITVANGIITGFVNPT